MKLNNHAGIFLFVSGLFISACPAQELMDHQVLTVPERCALKLIQEPVVAKLKLSSLQLQAIHQAEKEYINETNRLNQKNPPRPADLEHCDKKYANAFLSKLSPTQKQELLRIGVSELGIEALLDKSIATRIGLTDSQMQKVSSLLRAYEKKNEDVSAMTAKAIEALPQPKAGADRTQYDKTTADVYASYAGERQRIAREKQATENKIVALFTTAQRAKWFDLSKPSQR